MNIFLAFIHINFIVIKMNGNHIRAAAP